MTVCPVTLSLFVFFFFARIFNEQEIVWPFTTDVQRNNRRGIWWFFFSRQVKNSFFLLKPVLVEIFFLKNNFIFELIQICHKMNKIVHYNENCLCLMSVEFTHMSVWSCHTVRINRFWTCFNYIVRKIQSPCYRCMSLRSSRDK
jgi:hypothetical protein